MHPEDGWKNGHSRGLTRDRYEEVLAEQDHSPRFFCAPGFNVETMLSERDQIRLEKTLDPTALWLDAQDGQRYLQLLKDWKSFAAVDASMFEGVARKVHLRTQALGMSKEHVVLLALGIGDGRKETALMEQLLKQYPFQMAAYFLDVNQTLVQAAYQTACDFMSQHPLVSVLPILGSFHQLQTLPTLFYSPKGTRQLRLGCMLGDTFGQLPDEQAFLKESLSAFQKGDLFLMDVKGTSSPVLTEEEVKKQDSFFTTALEQEAWLRFLGGFAEKHLGSALSEVRTRVKLSAGSISGSYGIEFFWLGNQGEDLSLLTMKRYSLETLSKVFVAHGWMPVSRIPFAEDAGRHLCLFERMT